MPRKYTRESRRRKHQLSLRKPEYWPAARAESIIEGDYVKFMDMVENLLIRLGVKNKNDVQIKCSRYEAKPANQIHFRSLIHFRGRYVLKCWRLVLITQVFVHLK